MTFKSSALLISALATLGTVLAVTLVPGGFQPKFGNERFDLRVADENRFRLGDDGTLPTTLPNVNVLNSLASPALEIETANLVGSEVNHSGLAVGRDSTGPGAFSAEKSTRNADAKSNGAFFRDVSSWQLGLDSDNAGASPSLFGRGKTEGNPLVDPANVSGGGPGGMPQLFYPAGSFRGSDNPSSTEVGLSFGTLDPTLTAALTTTSPDAATFVAGANSGDLLNRLLPKTTETAATFGGAWVSNVPSLLGSLLGLLNAGASSSVFGREKTEGTSLLDTTNILGGGPAGMMQIFFLPMGGFRRSENPSSTGFPGKDTLSAIGFRENDNPLPSNLSPTEVGARFGTLDPTLTAAVPTASPVATALVAVDDSGYLLFMLVPVIGVLCVSRQRFARANA